MVDFSSLNTRIRDFSLVSPSSVSVAGAIAGDETGKEIHVVTVATSDGKILVRREGEKGNGLLRVCACVILCMLTPAFLFFVVVLTSLLLFPPLAGGPECLAVAPPRCPGRGYWLPCNPPARCPHWHLFHQGWAALDLYFRLGARKQEEEGRGWSEKRCVV